MTDKMPLNAHARRRVVPEPANGVPARRLDDGDLLRELTSLHRTRDHALQFGSPRALARHNARTVELENEYLNRLPVRLLSA
jgi:hypothetical protein